MSDGHNTPPLPLNARLAITLLEYIVDVHMPEIHGAAQGDSFEVFHALSMTIENVEDICTHFKLPIFDVLEAAAK